MIEKRFNSRYDGAAVTAQVGIVATLQGAGHDVQVSDLYAMNWNPVASAADFQARSNPDYLIYALEQREAVKAGVIAADIAAELDKLRAITGDALFVKSGRGIVATTTPGVLFDSTADTAFGLLLMVTRRFGEAERLVRAGTPWRYRTTFMLGHAIQGMQIGLIGAGQIGTAMARRCKAFGMRIAYASEHPMKEPARSELEAVGLPIDELVATSDVISLHCPLTPQTHHILDAQRLAAMKPGSYIINTARGACIDEKALVEALKSGHLAGVGLDVYEHEPAIEPGLLGMENT